jgi:hypothetical protein
MTKKIGNNLKLKKFFYFFFFKNCNLHILGLYKGRPIYRRSLQSTKKASSNSIIQNMEFLFFSLFLWVIFALRDPDPDPATQMNVDPCGSGSATLMSPIPAQKWEGLQKQDGQTLS